MSNKKQMCLIVAMDQNEIIGDGKKMLWHLPEDLKRFRELTIGQVVVMGRKTFESLPYKNGLPSRINIVLTNTPEKYKSIPDKLYFIRENELDELIGQFDKRIFVIGGGEIYRKLFHRCHMVYITIVYRSESEVYSDTVFFDCEINPKEFIKIYESGIHIKADLEYEYFVYMKPTK